MHSPFDPETEKYFFPDPQFPAEYRGLILKGATMNTYMAGAGQVIVQTYTGPEFSLQFGIFKLLALIRMILGDPEFATGSLLAIKGDANLNAGSRNRQQLREGQFSLLKAESKEVQLRFEHSGEQQLLEIS